MVNIKHVAADISWGAANILHGAANILLSVDDILYGAADICLPKTHFPKCFLTFSRGKIHFFYKKIRHKSNQNYFFKQNFLNYFFKQKLFNQSLFLAKNGFSTLEG